ncbi:MULTISPECIES: response regulator transcription factor [Enterococcus]|uniref:Two-component system, LytTR family, response regulator AgrA n=1 Tax=Candidatus Enterococcus ferrettii TaxID=2815324 RepID=A0ABV0EJY0_9ENTE|nr:LytTR family DNA-binding domain-containing protein [Enterococcus sp. 665A]MBO1338248.1 response regulator transcription factor [Enterococcus sp. 665A]
MSYPIIICEDQLIQLQQLDTIIQNYLLFHNDPFEVVLKTQNPLEVKKYLQQFQPKNGVYFLDIDLNHTIDGIDLAETIRNADAQAKIIFITTHEELAPLTLKRRVEALGFITKDQPLEDYRTEIMELLSVAQERIATAKNDQGQNFTFSIGTQTFNLNLAEVLFLEPSTIPHRVVLYTVNGHYEFYGKLQDLEKAYPALFRASRSCLVNLTKAREIDFANRTIHFNAELSRTFALGKAKKLKERLEKMK